MIPVQFDPSLPAVSVRHAVKTFGVEEKAGRLWQRLTGANGVVQHKKRSIRAVDDVSFEVHRREIFGILGPNGGGKSTLVRLLSTLLIPDSGTITVFGYDVLADERTVKRLLNRVSVDAAFFKKLSPLENLMYAARLYGVDPVAARRQTFEILQRLGIEREAVTEPMEEMSRGMQQKVAIARAFLTQPVLLLLDEPTTGLDPQARHLLWDRLYRLKQRGVTLVLTTHYMDEAEQLCDRLVIMDKGKIVAEGRPRDLIKQHVSSHVVEVDIANGARSVSERPELAELTALAKRHERHQDRLLLYVDNGEEVVAKAAHLLPDAETLIRRSTLEDVFLKITGRGLAE
ncbi:MAG TPA: hypothetical protein DEP84_00985 [Chloroflexi bacterium]|nr:hypothetical protein [Chloroflexota bacterium]